MEQGILLERKVRAHTIVLGRVIRQQMAEMPFAQHHDMVEALASDRADQPFNMTVLPR
jgi:chromosome condensin MukBEF complex kleisin-like MukF subunit